MVLVLGMGYYYFALLLPRVHELRAAQQLGRGFSYGADLYPLWLSGRELLLKRTDPYTLEMTRKIQVGLYGRVLDAHHRGDPPETYRTFSYPLYADVLALPLLPFRFRVVQILLTGVLPLLAGAMVVATIKALDLGWSWRGVTVAVLLCLCSYPVLEAVYAQQPALLVGASLCALALALVRKRLWLAGGLLAVATVKPQMVLLLAVWLIVWSVFGWRTHKQLLIAFIITLGLLLGISEWMLPGWWREWWHVLVGYRQYTIPPLAVLLLGKRLGIMVEGALLAVATIVGWRARRESVAGGGFWVAASVILTVTVLTLPTGDAVYDQLALLLPIFVLFSQRSEILNGSRPVRLLAIVSVIAFMWQFILGSVISVGALLGSGWTRSNSVLLLPVRMASSLPITILALLLLLGFPRFFGREGRRFSAPIDSIEDAGERFAVGRGKVAHD